MKCAAHGDEVYALVASVCFWHIASFRCGAEFGRDRRIADMDHIEQIGVQAVEAADRKTQPYTKRIAHKGIGSSRNW